MQGVITVSRQVLYCLHPLLHALYGELFPNDFIISLYRACLIAGLLGNRYCTCTPPIEIVTIYQEWMTCDLLDSRRRWAWQDFLFLPPVICILHRLVSCWICAYRAPVVPSIYGWTLSCPAPLALNTVCFAVGGHLGLSSARFCRLFFSTPLFVCWGHCQISQWGWCQDGNFECNEYVAD